MGALALFVSLGGVGYSATGGAFILGKSNTANKQSVLSAPVKKPALQVTNTNTAAGATALGLKVASGHAPFTVNSGVKVTNLNADRLDGFDSASFLLLGTALSFPVSGAGGVVDVTNTGAGNGVQGRTQDPGASAVYGEHVGPGGFGVAGRAGDSGHAIYGDNTGTGFAGYFEDKVHVGGDLDVSAGLNLGGALQCTGCVDAADVVGKVGNADALDGIDSTGFMQGGGVADGQAVALAPNSTAFLGPAIGGLVRLRYQCPLALGGNGAFRIINSSSGAANLFVDSGGANPDYLQLGAGGFVDYPAASGGESFHIQIQGAPGVAVVTAGTVHRGASNDCHAQAVGFMAM
jgi:hypothetical protein